MQRLRAPPPRFYVDHVQKLPRVSVGEGDSRDPQRTPTGETADGTDESWKTNSKALIPSLL